MKYPVNPTSRQVLDRARAYNFSIFPILCYVQRQQLIFLWRTVHSANCAIPRIVLHDRLYSANHKTGGGGQRKTYKSSTEEALHAFDTTYEQCQAMTKLAWYQYVEGPGLLSAAAHWEAQPKAYLKIDRVYTKEQVKSNLPKARRKVIPVEDHDLDA